MAVTITNPQEAAAALAKKVDAAHNVVFFGGAGVSTASGIPDFRSADGLYNAGAGSYAYSPEVMLSHTFYATHTAEFFDFYRQAMVAPARAAVPNSAHRKLAELEAAGRLRAVVTQNIDGLHQAAGSVAVHELHGSVHRNVCTVCGATYDAVWVLSTTGVPTCERCGAVVKPDVVLYEEALNERVLAASVAAIAAADLLIVGGTSLVVYPAAGLLHYFGGSELVVCNLQPTAADTSASLVCACDIAAAFSW